MYLCEEGVTSSTESASRSGRRRPDHFTAAALRRQPGPIAFATALSLAVRARLVELDRAEIAKPRAAGGAHRRAGKNVRGRCALRQRAANTGDDRQRAQRGRLPDERPELVRRGCLRSQVGQDEFDVVRFSRVKLFSFGCNQIRLRPFPSWTPELVRTCLNKLRTRSDQLILVIPFSFPQRRRVRCTQRRCALRQRIYPHTLRAKSSGQRLQECAVAARHPAQQQRRDA